jgi:hypothetical protein
LKAKSIVIVIFAAALVVGGAFTYRFVASPISNHTQSICESCFTAPPVGDIIIPQIATGSSGKSNLQLNVTQGENLNLTVEVFLSINASVYASFNLRISPSANSTVSGSPFSVSFAPQRFEALENRNATTVMTIVTSEAATKGLYSTELVVTDSKNENYTWGTQIQINVE